LSFAGKKQEPTNGIGKIRKDARLNCILRNRSGNKNSVFKADAEQE